MFLATKLNNFSFVLYDLNFIPLWILLTKCVLLLREIAKMRRGEIMLGGRK
jgi:hypothetical protein